ncbi:MAG: peptidoglycan-binding protein [Clostridia bacterium]|nr:peptidoglycan-binding protein [Clostridia bacterium]
MKKLLSALIALALLCAAPALAEAPLGDVMDALGGGCRETYEALRAEGPVGIGNRGEAVRGVQETLVDFGQDIVADGIFGAKTLSALNAVQASFGLAETGALDADGYAALLPRLLALRDPDAAAVLLTGPLGGEYLYIRGCVNRLAGRFYTARRDFIESRWGDWAARAGACALAWPEDGEIYRDDALRGRGVELTVQVNDETERATLVKIYAADGALAAALFIGGEGRATAFLPGGEYALRDGTGTLWFGLAEAFGDEGTYEELTFDGGKTVSLAAGHAYTVTINAHAVNPGASVVGAVRAGWQGF